MDLIITILPVVIKDLPISPRFTPYDFLSRCKFSTLTTRQPTVKFYSRSHAFRYERKNTNPTLVRIELTTSAPSRCAGYLLTRPLGRRTEKKKEKKNFQHAHFIPTTNSGCGKREAHINWSMVKPEKPSPVTRTTLRTSGHVPV